MTDATGLTTDEARRRLQQLGPNTIATDRRRSALIELLRRFGSPLILLLIGAALVAGISGDRRSFAVIVVMVALSVVLDFVQEHRAGRAAERLRRSVHLRATVIRDGVAAERLAETIVPGDLIALAAGDLIPADARLVEARDLFVNQSLLTGEPYPVEKHAGLTNAGANLAEQPALVLMGTSVVSGTARAEVTQTGARTCLGQIGASLQRQPPPSAFEQGTRAFGLLIVRLALFLVVAVLLVNAWRGRPWLDSFLFALALAVGLTPELLPMVVSVTLSRGALRLARLKVLVKRLSAIHDLGSMDVLCTDKTGTLTEARIELAAHLGGDGEPSPRALALGFWNSHFQSGLRSPLDDAILAAGEAQKEVAVADVRKLDETPFDFERRRVAVLVQRGAAGPLLVVKGAAEDVIGACSFIEAGDESASAIDEAARARLNATLGQLGGDGFRVLGVAVRRLSPGAPLSKRDEVDLTFVGFLAFRDPPKDSARVALRDLAALGVAVKVVTGDNPLVARHVCAELGLPAGGVLTGAEIQAMDDDVLAARVEATALFCRMTPAQKNRVILALKRRKHVVGFLGDGINDAPALHAADVGISVEGGVDVAKEAADLILLERDLSVLRDGVIEGRRTLGNIVKYLLMGTSSNFGNMFSMAGAALFLPFLPMLPIQILVNNFLYDLSEVPIPTDRVDDEYTRRPHRWHMPFIQRYMLTLGPVSSLFDFLTFFVLYKIMGAGVGLFQTGWFMESLATQVLVIFVIRTRGNPLRSRPSAALALTSALVVAAGLILPLTAAGAALGFVRPPAALFGVISVTVAGYLLVAEAAKRWFFRRVAAAD